MPQSWALVTHTASSSAPLPLPRRRQPPISSSSQEAHQVPARTEHSWGRRSFFPDDNLPWSTPFQLRSPLPATSCRHSLGDGLPVLWASLLLNSRPFPRHRNSIKAIAFLAKRLTNLWKCRSPNETTAFLADPPPLAAADEKEGEDQQLQHAMKMSTEGAPHAQGTRGCSSRPGHQRVLPTLSAPGGRSTSRVSTWKRPPSPSSGAF